MVSCENYAEMLSARRDDELDQDDCLILEEHLESCSECRALMMRFEAVDNAITGSEAKLTPGLFSRIENVVESDSRPKSSRILHILTAAVMLIAVSLVITMFSDKADADRLKEEISLISEINNEVLSDQEAMLNTFGWELAAMKLMINSSDLDSKTAEPILNRIKDLQLEIEKVRNPEETIKGD